jgi:multisubunit Na+/H+ antiporter MnhB subunit
VGDAGVPGLIVRVRVPVPDESRSAAREAPVLDAVLSLVLGVVITVVVGRALRAAGRPFLDDVMQDDRVADSMARLLTLLFYLVSLGATFLVSTYQMPAGVNWLYATSIKVGIVLLVIGALHGATLVALLVIKKRRRIQLAEEAIVGQRRQRSRRSPREITE